ncbi:major facilitator transporter [Rhodopseudomonas palustris]|uniref:Major facilitator transporter n=2 Tax=Nitrobacteraceae TaxID=41294 RepID=A0A0D7EGQ0_RHOPL|nr:major facilitator transporter [Rhodopseudomonas palustris]
MEMATIEGLGAIDKPAPDTMEHVYRKITLRIIPFLFACYVLNYIDRVNISFASLQFRQDLGISAAAYGFGVGIFFVGYVIFEVPSNLLMQRIGARRTMMRIMVLWGLVSIATMFVTSATQFYVVRALLGVAEAGFFPGVIFYLTLWFPSALRGRIMAMFVLAIAVSGVIGGPVSGLIMSKMADLGGLRGWQWLFLIEGIPPILIGLMAYFYLDDGPEDAKWLTAAEKRFVVANLAVESASRESSKHGSFWTALRDPRLYAAAAAWFTMAWCGSVINYFSPQIIRNSGVSDTLTVGLLSAIPYAVGAVGMVLINRHSDLKLERRWHYAFSVALAATAIALLPSVAQNWKLAIVLLAMLSVGYLGGVALFWSIPTAYLSKRATAGSVALISSIGQCGGLTAPNIIGWTQQATGNFAVGFYTIAIGMVIGTIIMLIGLPARLLRERYIDNTPV